jgi:hypothetical protein
VKAHKETPFVVRSDLRFIQGNEHKQEANAKSDDESADDEHGDLDGTRGEGTTDDIEDTADEYSRQSALALVDEYRCVASNKTSYGEQSVRRTLEGRRVGLIETHIRAERRLAKGRGYDTSDILHSTSDQSVIALAIKSGKEYPHPTSTSLCRQTE